jgi:glutamate racemase
VENNEHTGPGADHFIRKNLNNIFEKSGDIDVILLACTHYPLLKEKIEKYLPAGVKLISQGEIVAQSLDDYLKRHTEIEQHCTRNGNRSFYTTDSTQDFDNHASLFFGKAVRSRHVDIENVHHIDT